MSETMVKSKTRSENNNTYHWKVGAQRNAPCSCARELPDELYMADIEEPYMIDRTSPKTKSDKVSFCDNEISDLPNEISGSQRQPSPTTYSEVIILDSIPPGPWPIKRSASLESRDNPFVPGSDLCKEAEEILQKATIIRDRFILRDESGEVPDTEVTSESHPNSPGNGKDCSVVEESVSPQTSAPVNTAPKARQNGKIDDNVSPTAVKVELGGARSDGLAVDAENKDKKKQKKCCSVM
ncbi:uncharacterized protein [Argopecten irradians]|uniref:uncharacterized protein isoform X4 n=1 Tax=Argopecten irradians TaxID=31199 RepID=UPI003712285D